MSEKVIPEAPNYAVHSDGYVINLDTGYSLRGSDHNGKALRITIRLGPGKSVNRYLHYLVAEAFLPGYRPGMMVTFIDGNYKNCKSDNLRLHYDQGVRGKVTSTKIEVIETGEIFDNMQQVARAIGGQPSNVARVLNGYMHQHKGYHFRLVNPKEARHAG